MLTFISITTGFGQGSINEVEPNNTFAQANTALPLISANTTIAGAITPVGDVDTYRINVAVAGVVQFEVFNNAAANDCTAAATMDLRLYNSAGTAIVADTAGTGIGPCGAISIPLDAGTYYIRNEERGNNALIALYRLRIIFPTSNGNEVEPNETQATATLIPGPPFSYIFGDHSLADDSDFYRITVGSGQSLRAEIVEGDRAAETCESNGIDSRLTLYDSTGTELVDDDDSGRGFCSLIDGKGTTPLDAGASNLAAGTYYIQVRRSDLAAGAQQLFVYRLALELTVSPTAASVSIGGRVVNENGRAVNNASVLLTDSAGNTRTARTSSFGYYRFDSVEVGHVYILNVNSKQYEMAPQVVSITDQITELDLTVQSKY